MSNYINRFLGTITVLTLVSCSGQPANKGTSEEVGTTLFALSDGTPAGPNEGRFVVSLEGCTGVLLSRHAILTAAHCVLAGDRVEIAVKRGAEGDQCLRRSASGGTCQPIPLRVKRDANVDLALLTSTSALVKDAVSSFPKIVADGAIPQIDVWGYGSGSYVQNGAVVDIGPGVRLLHAQFDVSQQLYAELEASASGATSVCDGDSGGPAMVAVDGAPALAGILHASEADPLNPRCTKAQGVQKWIRPGAFLSFIETAVGPCERTTINQHVLASCSGIPQDKRSDGSDEVLKYYNSLPGSGVQSPQTSPPTAKLAQSAETFRVSVVAPSGPVNVDIDTKTLTANFGSVYPMVDGHLTAPATEPMVLKERGWSQNVDNRFRITGTQAPEVMRMQEEFHQITPRDDYSTGSCSATLIGKRLVRTAAHCLLVPNVDSTGYVWATTSKIKLDLHRDGESVRLTVSPLFYEIGGNYIPNGCWNNRNSDPFRNNLNGCVLEDWALLVLPEDVWASLGYVPLGMGYQGLNSTDLNRKGTSAGYPACLQTNSPSGCPSTVALNNFYKYADTNSDCTVGRFTSGTVVFRSGCDISEGNSGGPFYDPTKRYLLGNASWQACTTCGYFGGAGTLGTDALNTDDFYMPNYYMGTNTWLFAEQNRLRSAYP